MREGIIAHLLQELTAELYLIAGPLNGRYGALNRATSIASEEFLEQGCDVL